jgi:hypothetical protein
LLRIDERPDFIALDATNVQIANVLLVIFGAAAAKIGEQI